MITGSSFVARTLARVVLAAAVLALLPYAWSPIYRFPAATPFAGTQLWNPYGTTSGAWQRANLHAHGHTWGGLTSGAQTNAAVVARYRALGYSVAGVSNYQSIAAFSGVDTLPLYEHGFNLGKTHQLAVGARAVDWIDFLFWQTLSNQQYVIDRVHSKADVVSLNHPSSRDAYDVDAMRTLSGYDLIEVVNGPFTAEDVWDAALSAGRPVWAVANDDTHDIDDPRRTAAGWNMIDAASPSTADVIAALRAGRFYAVLRTGAVEGANVTTLSGVSIEQSTMRVELRGAPATVAFIGQDGQVRATLKDRVSAEYAFTPNDTYVRAVVTGPQTTLYLNPVLRWDGSALPSPKATVNEAWTWIQRGGIAVGGVLLFVALRGRTRDAATSRAHNPVPRRA